MDGWDTASDKNDPLLEVSDFSARRDEEKMLRGTLSSPQISMKIGELEGWYIRWDVKFECKVIRFSDGNTLGDELGVSGSLTLSEKRMMLDSNDVSFGICFIKRSMDQRLVEGLTIRAFLPKEEMYDLSRLFIAGKSFDRVSLHLNDLFAVDENRELLPEGHLFWAMTGEKLTGQDFSQISDITLTSH